MYFILNFVSDLYNLQCVIGKNLSDTFTIQNGLK